MGILIILIGWFLLLNAQGIAERIHPRNQGSRIVLGWRIALALHDTSLGLDGEREAHLTLRADGKTPPYRGVSVSFPEFGAPRLHPIWMPFPWLLDEKDRAADWSQLSDEGHQD